MSRVFLVEMFQAEWWTAGRSRADVEKMLRHSDLGLGNLVMDAIMSAPGLASVQHFELYCVPEMVPFYRKWEFSDELSGLRFMRARK